MPTVNEERGSPVLEDGGLAAEVRALGAPWLLVLASRAGMSGSLSVGPEGATRPPRAWIGSNVSGSMESARPA